MSENLITEIKPLKEIPLSTQVVTMEVFNEVIGNILQQLNDLGHLTDYITKEMLYKYFENGYTIVQTEDGKYIVEPNNSPTPPPPPDDPPVEPEDDPPEGYCQVDVEIYPPVTP